MFMPIEAATTGATSVPSLLQNILSQPANVSGAHLGGLLTVFETAAQILKVVILVVCGIAILYGMLLLGISAIHPGSGRENRMHKAVKMMGVAAGAAMLPLLVIPLLQNFLLPNILGLVTVSPMFTHVLVRAF